MARRAAAQSNRWLKILAWTLGSLVVLIIAVLLIGQAWLNRYLRSPEFRAKLEERTGLKLRSKVEIAPIHLEGVQFYCERFGAEGTPEAPFSVAKVDEIRGEVRLPSIFQVLRGNWKFDVANVEVQKVALEFYRDRLDFSLPDFDQSQRLTDLNSVIVRNANIAWGGGGITGASVRATAANGGWKIEADHGRLTQLGLPGIEMTSLRMMLKTPVIFIQEARLRHDTGEVTVSGEIDPKERADLLFGLDKINVTPLLPEDWRVQLHGQLGGDLRLQLPLREFKEGGRLRPVLTGKLRLDDGVLEALPVLNKIADYLKTEQFRRLKLDQATAEVRVENGVLTVSNLLLEARQWIVLRGGFTFKNDRVDGTFDLGITPGPLQFLPGTQEKVFNTSGSGYAWTKLRVTGPLNALDEDLTPRLTAAMTGTLVEKIPQQAVDTAVDTAKKGATGLLDFLFGK